MAIDEAVTRGYENLDSSSRMALERFLTDKTIQSVHLDRLNTPSLVIRDTPRIVNAAVRRGLLGYPHDNGMIDKVTAEVVKALGEPDTPPVAVPVEKHPFPPPGLTPEQIADVHAAAIRGPVEMFEPNKPPVWRGIPGYEKLSSGVRELFERFCADEKLRFVYISRDGSPPGTTYFIPENTAETLMKSFNDMPDGERFRFGNMFVSGWRSKPLKTFSLAEDTAGLPAGTELERDAAGKFKPVKPPEFFPWLQGDGDAWQKRAAHELELFKRGCRVESIRAEVVALQVEVESMKAANEKRRDLGHAQAYDESSFMAMASRIHAMANELAKT